MNPVAWIRYRRATAPQRDALWSVKSQLSHFKSKPNPAIYSRKIEQLMKEKEKLRRQIQDAKRSFGKK